MRSRCRPESAGAVATGRTPATDHRRFAAIAMPRLLQRDEFTNTFGAEPAGGWYAARRLGVVPHRRSDRCDQRPRRRRAGIIGEHRQRVAGKDHANGDARPHADDGARFGVLLAARPGHKRRTRTWPLRSPSGSCIRSQNRRWRKPLATSLMAQPSSRPHLRADLPA